jgi:hypothetical protein
MQTSHTIQNPDYTCLCERLSDALPQVRLPWHVSSPRYAAIPKPRAQMANFRFTTLGICSVCTGVRLMNATWAMWQQADNSSIASHVRTRSGPYCHAASAVVLRLDRGMNVGVGVPRSSLHHVCRRRPHNICRKSAPRCLVYRDCFRTLRMRATEHIDVRRSPRPAAHLGLGRGVQDRDSKGGQGALPLAQGPTFMFKPREASRSVRDESAPRKPQGGKRMRPGSSDRRHGHLQVPPTRS